MSAMSPNVRAAMGEWEGMEALKTLPDWAAVRAAEIVEATVPQVCPSDTRNMLYCMPSGLKLRLTIEIATALVEARS